MHIFSQKKKKRTPLLMSPTSRYHAWSTRVCVFDFVWKITALAVHYFVRIALPSSARICRSILHTYQKHTPYQRVVYPLLQKPHSLLNPIPVSNVIMRCKNYTPLPLPNITTQASSQHRPKSTLHNAKKPDSFPHSTNNHRNKYNYNNAHYIRRLPEYGYTSTVTSI